jgi:protein-S-isoprenylcysteine O-methyltransferase Ste14
METAAYWLTLLLVVAAPPTILFWFLVHPFAEYWRRLGPAKAYPLLVAVVAATMVAIFRARGALLRIHFGVSAPLTLLAIIVFLIAFVLGLLRFKRLTPAVMLGLPELSPAESPGALVTEGIYAYIRHPRYVEVGLGLAALALFSSYLAAYVLALAYVPVIYLVVLLEERELRQRFGREYEDYCRRVPRFLPRIGRRRSSSC